MKWAMITVVIVVFSTPLAAIDVLSYLGSHFVDSLEETPASLPLPMLPQDVTEQSIGGIADLKRSFAERDTLDEGDSIRQAAVVEYNLHRLQAAQKLAAAMYKHRSVEMALACVDRDARAVVRRAAVIKHVNTSFTRQAARDSSRKAETLAYEGARSRNSITRHKLAEVTALIKEQRTANYSKLHLNPLFAGVLTTMYDKLARSQIMVESSTKRQDDWVNALITSHTTIASDLKCTQCEVTQAVLQHQRNDTRLELLGVDRCPAVTAAVTRDKQKMTMIANLREEMWAASERVFRTIDGHRALLREQNAGTVSSLDNISRGVFGRSP